ncbi:MAG TPA: hypothetical protein PK733_01845 [Clostridiales bacterium]|nr:hypothetical protein [Clostridiales bacterium]
MNSRNSCGNASPGMPVPYMQSTAISPGYEPKPFQPSGAVPIPMPSLPTGIPTGPAYGGTVPTTPMPIPQPPAQAPQTVSSPYYLAGFLRNYVGRMVRVEFLMGTTAPLVDRIGNLMEVGASYIVLRPVGTDDLIVADLYSIKFVTIYR